MTQPQVCPKIPGVSCALTDVATGATLIRRVIQCTRCGWLDPAALDRWAESALKEQQTRNAQNIALASEIEPFSFVEAPGQVLSLSEILGQALGASSMCWIETPTGEFDSTRARRIYQALELEIQQEMEMAWQRGHSAASEETR